MVERYLLPKQLSDTTRFYFDDNSNRVKLTTKAGGVYYYVYDPTASIPAVIYEQGPGNRYLNIRNTDGSLITRETYDATGTRTMSRTYHYDGLGSTIALSGENGNVTDTYTYDAWGNVTPGEDNVTTDNPYQYVGELGYYTHYQEPGFAMLSLGVRFYDPSTGRFTQLDPIKDGVNWYGYVEGNPLGAVDPSGEVRYEPGKWQCREENCYNYACNKHRGRFCDPGCESGTKWPNFPPAPGVPDGIPSCSNLIRNAIADGLRPVSNTGKCPSGYHRVRLFVDLDGDGHFDYHWYRQDEDGTWSNKHGRLPCYRLPDADDYLRSLLQRSFLMCIDAWWPRGVFVLPEHDAAKWGLETKCAPDLCAKD